MTLIATLAAGIISLPIILMLASRDYDERKFLSAESQSALKVWGSAMLFVVLGLFLDGNSVLYARDASFLLGLDFFGLSVYYAYYRPVSRKEVAVWLKSLGILLKSRMRIDQALDLMARSCPSRKMSKISRIMRRAVMEGESLSYLMGLNGIGEVFGAEVQDAVREGELHGDLPLVLIELSGMADFFKSKAVIDKNAPHAESLYKPTGHFDGVKIPEINKLRKPLENVDLKIISDAAAEYTAAEEKDPTLKLRLLSVSNAPGVRVILTVLRMATAEKIPEVILAMEENKKFRGMRVSFCETGGEFVSVMTIPQHVAPLALNELKLLADIPYWQKNSARSSFIVHYEGKPYRLTIRLAERNGEEIIRIAIVEEVLGYAAYTDIAKAS